MSHLLVALCTTTSKPCRSGRKPSGVAKVLSMTETMPRSRAKAAAAGRSAMRTSGFVIDSR